MATYTYPTSGSAYLLSSMSWRLQDFVLLSTPTYGGKTRTYEIPGQQIIVTLGYGPQTHEERREIRGWWAKAGQQRNRVSIYDYAAPLPRGTISGSPLVKTTVAAGASSIVGKSMGTGTFMRGDMIKLTDGLHVVTDDTSAPVSGEATINFAPPTRVQVSADSSIVYSMPTGTFMVTAAPDIVFQGSGPHPPFSVQLLEVGE